MAAIDEGPQQGRGGTATQETSMHDYHRLTVSPASSVNLKSRGGEGALLSSQAACGGGWRQGPAVKVTAGRLACCGHGLAALGGEEAGCRGQGALWAKEGRAQDRDRSWLAHPPGVGHGDPLAAVGAAHSDGGDGATAAGVLRRAQPGDRSSSCVSQAAV